MKEGYWKIPASPPTLGSRGKAKDSRVCPITLPCGHQFGAGYVPYYLNYF